MLLLASVGVAVVLLSARLLYKGDVTKALGLLFISSAIASLVLSSGVMTGHANAIAMKNEHEGMNHIKELHSNSEDHQVHQYVDANNKPIKRTGGDHLYFV